MCGSGLAFKPIEKETETKACSGFLSTKQEIFEKFKSLKKEMHISKKIHLKRNEQFVGFACKWTDISPECWRSTTIF